MDREAARGYTVCPRSARRGQRNKRKPREQAAKAASGIRTHVSLLIYSLNAVISRRAAVRILALNELLRKDTTSKSLSMRNLHKMRLTTATFTNPSGDARWWPTEYRRGRSVRRRSSTHVEGNSVSRAISAWNARGISQTAGARFGRGLGLKRCSARERCALSA